MHIANELKVGLVIVVCAVIFFLGVRYFEAIPLFSGTYELYTTFDDAGGLQNGNTVRINGVNVGSVTAVRLQESDRTVRVTFKIEDGVELYEGSTVEIAGISALGDPLLSISLGPPTNPVIPPGGFVPSDEDDLLGSLLDRAPGLVDNVEAALSGTDEVVTAAERALTELEQVIGPGDANLRQTLAALTATTTTLGAILEAEQARLDAVLVNVEGVTGDLAGITATRRDSISLAVDNLNAVLRRLNQNLAALETTTTGLDTLFVRLERGDGTLGLLLNDPGVYNRLDSLLLNLNGLVEDFQQRPGYYLKEMELVDVF